MGIKQLYNDNLQKLPNEYGDVSVMRFLILPGELHLGGPKPNCHNPGLGAPILYKLPLLPPGGKNISFFSGIQGFC